jgi:predicted nucleic acid-binding protein
VGGGEVRLVDTSSWIEYLRGRNNVVADRVRDLMRDDEAALCEMTLVELWNGAQGEAEKRVLRELQGVLPLLPIHAAVWLQAVSVAQKCRGAGVTAPVADVVIAACALHYGVEVEHCDGHFDAIKAGWQTVQ